MRSSVRLTAYAAVLIALTVSPHASAQGQHSSPWAGADSVFAQQGKDLPGGVHKYGWPRRDLKVVLDGVAIEPALALGSWAGFMDAGAPGQAMAMGDLALLSEEVTPVVRALQAGGMMVTAIHNHLIGESPRVIYVHFEGRGSQEALAKTLKSALAVTGTPPPGAPSNAPALTAEERGDLAAFQKALGVEGQMAGRVLQVGIPRADPIEEEGMMVPPSMGMACGINAQPAGARVAATGDFVLTSQEVEWVARALEQHGIAVTAIHSHMLGETPRLFFLHFWALGSPKAVGEGLRSALEHVQLKGFTSPPRP